MHSVYIVCHLPSLLYTYSLLIVMMTLLLCTGMHCTECGYNCHEKCVQHVPKNCTKLRPASHLTSLSTDQSSAAAAAGVQSTTAAESSTDSTLVGSVTASTVSATRGICCLCMLCTQIGGLVECLVRWL